MDTTQDSGDWRTVGPPEELDSYPFLKGLKDQVGPIPKGTPHITLFTSYWGSQVMLGESAR